MLASVSSVVQVLVAAAVSAAFIAWIVYLLLPEKVFMRDRGIVKKYRRRIEQMQISDIAEIKYHYHAVVGFVAAWEFIDKDANSLSVDAEARGMDDVLNGLEKQLPGFSLADFQRKFDAGDVEDSLDVWKAT